MKDRPPSAKRNRLDNLTQAVQQLKHVSDNFNENSIDEHDAFGSFVGATLKKLRTRDALMAQNEIQQILLKYRLNVECEDNYDGSTSRHSGLSNHSNLNVDYSSSDRDSQIRTPDHLQETPNIIELSYSDAVLLGM